MSAFIFTSSNFKLSHLRAILARSAAIFLILPMMAGVSLFSSYFFRNWSILWCFSWSDVLCRSTSIRRYWCFFELIASSTRGSNSKFRRSNSERTVSFFFYILPAKYSSSGSRFLTSFWRFLKSCSSLVGKIVPIFRRTSWVSIFFFTVKSLFRFESDSYPLFLPF